ncbi:jg14631 [Pararge aegeria aegeria]|uniref:Jg14631 protein n=1 Tax=Pararge aegeria aegeria TaxID=348720 RepID=A0A8S4RZA5_9NEOP|nr:jg14631 [Pararge aegeria aegeria]
MASNMLVTLLALTLFATSSSGRHLTKELKDVQLMSLYCPIVVARDFDPSRIPRVIQSISCRESWAANCVTVTKEVTVFSLSGVPGTKWINIGCVHRSDYSQPAGSRQGD